MGKDKKNIEGWDSQVCSLIGALSGVLGGILFGWIIPLIVSLTGKAKGRNLAVMWLTWGFTGVLLFIIVSIKSSL